MNKFNNFLYEIALLLLALVALPKMLYQLIVYKKYRKSFLVRFGYHFPKIIKKDGEVLIWVHAVSMGETKAVSNVVKELRKNYPNGKIVISSTTETGHAEGKRSIPGADYHVFLPFDFRFVVKPIIQRASPDLIVLCECDFWYNFLRFSKDVGAKIVLVNGKMSEKSMRRYKKVSFFSRLLMELFDVLCVQNELYYNRFIEAHAPANKLVITGNLKLDEDYPKLSVDEINQWKERLGIKADQTLLTIGSTHNPEEQIIIEILEVIWKNQPQLKVILVPRHPERFKEVFSLLKQEGIPTINFTNIKAATGKEKVILMDTMGMLRMCYQLADIALVGGSFTDKVGGHNILEPCWYGKPVLFGPHMRTQLELVDYILGAKAGVQVNQKELKELLKQWIENPSERAQVGERGVNLMANLKGSTKRTMASIEPLLIPNL